MKNVALFTIVASAAAASAQVTQLPNGTFQCAVANAAFCADASLGGPIIIRCDANKVGQPGNCNDNLAGEPPLGVGGALCFQTSPTSGDATCEKNCVVYASSGPSTLPTSVCKPSFTASSSSSSSTSSSTTSSTPTTTASANSTTSSSTIVKTTITTVVTKSASVTAPVTLSTGTGSGSTTTVGNGTLSNGGGNGGSGSGSATNTPVGPTSTKGITTVPTAGAATNGISVLALAGLVAAYML